MPDVAQLIQYGASPRASLGIVRATRALALLRGRDYALPQDVQDIAPDILRHRLVLSYDALADDIPADHIVDRVLAAVPLPTVAPAAERRRRPAAPARRRRSPAGRRPGRRRPAGPAMPLSALAAAPRPAAEPPAAVALDAGRAEPVLARLQLLITRKLDGLLQGDYLGLLPGPGHRGGGVAGVPARRRRAPDGLAGHRPHDRAARAADRRRPGAGDLAGGRPVGQPRLRHRPVPQARPGDRRRRRDRPPDRARRQPDRRGGRHRPRRAARRLPARPGRKEAQGLLRSDRRVPPSRPGRADLGALVDMLNRPPRRRGHGRGDLRLPGPAGRAGPGRCASSASGTTCSRSRSSTRASWSCPTSACWRFADPETGAGARGADRRPAAAARGTPRPPPPSAAAIAAALRGAGAAHLRLRTDSDWLLDIVRFVAAQRHARTRGTTR